MSALLDIDGLTVRYHTGRGALNAVSQVALQVQAGQTLGLVGESGCGKSSLGKALVNLVNAEAGSIRLGGVELRGLSGRQLKPHRRRIQMVFQDPASALDPRMSIAQAIAEPLALDPELLPAQHPARVRQLLAQVGLHPHLAERLPHQLSGGQRQRVVIARALAPRPQLIVCDEPVSALDVSLQAQVLNLLADLQAQLGVAYLFISHDLGVVQHIADRIAVMYLGEIVEVGGREAFWQAPAHPYTQALISAVPVMDPARSRIADKTLLAGDLPSPYTPPSGCRFHTRCPHAMAQCREQAPALRAIGPDHQVACHLHAPTGAPL